MAGAQPPAERERQLDTEAMTSAERRQLVAQLRRNWREEMSSAEVMASVSSWRSLSAGGWAPAMGARASSSLGW
jgi:hypothetical protein